MFWRMKAVCQRRGTGGMATGGKYCLGRMIAVREDACSRSPPSVFCVRLSRLMSQRNTSQYMLAQSFI